MRQLSPARLLRMPVAITVALLLLLTFAGTVMAYLYRAQVSISENASVDYDMLAVMWPQNNDFMAGNGFMESTANDTRVQTLGGVNKPRMVTENATLTAIPVEANSQTNLYFVTGESEQETMDIIFGNGGSVNVTDHASIELTDNGTITLTNIYIDTSTSDNLAYKEGALALTRGSGNVTAGILGTVADDTLQFSNDAEASTGSGTYVKLREVEITEPTQTIRVKFDLKVNSAGGTVAYGRIYKNGIAIGTEQTSVIATYATKSEDIVFNGVAGDLVQIYAKQTGGTLAFERNLRVYYDTGYQESVAVAADTSEYDPLVDKSPTFLGLGLDTDSIFPSSTDNLVMNYPLWSAYLSGTTVTGVDANQYTGTVTGTTFSSITGRYFDGANDKIEFQSGNQTLSKNSDHSVSMWINIPNEVGAGGQLLCFALDSNDRGGISYSSTFSDIRAGLTDGATYHSKSGSIAAGTGWHHVVWTYDTDTSTSLLYIDTSSQVGTGDPAITTTVGYQLGERMGLNDNDLKGYIAEYQAWDKTLSSAEVTQLYNDTSWHYSGTPIGDYVYSAASVPDNANDWIFGGFAYAESISISVDGVQGLYFAPNNIITNDGGGNGILPDRSGNGNTGNITWGVNPAGITVLLGSLTSSGQPVVGSTTDDSTNDLLPPAGGTDMNTDPDVTGALLTNPARPVIVAISSTTSLSEKQVWIFYGLAIVLLVTALAAFNVRGHHLITGIACAVAIIAQIVQTIFPLSIIVIAVLAIVLGVISERSPSI